jgi:uncharacterized cupredoxin-like copper-binding protein
MIARRVLFILAVGTLAVALAACGGGNKHEGEAASPYKTDEKPRATVTVGLVEWAVNPDTARVAPGPVQFVARNESTSMYHELVVLRVKDGGDYENTGEIEDLAPGTSGKLTLKLPPGKYVLACQIAKGERGSPVDHFQQGMHTPFEVR